MRPGAVGGTLELPTREETTMYYDDEVVVRLHQVEMQAAAHRRRLAREARGTRGRRHRTFRWLRLVPPGMSTRPGP
jgi:hypothetical protein